MARALSSVCLSEAGYCHASAVSVAGRGALLIGTSGAGKSELALQMIALGAPLIADDQVRLDLEGDDICIYAPTNAPAAIEARGVGLLNAPLASPAPLAVVVDLDHAEPERLPHIREIEVLGRSFPLILGAGQGHLAAKLLVYLKHGRFA